MTVLNMKQQVAALMAAGTRRAPAAGLMSLFSKVYGGVMAVRAACYNRQLLVKSRRLPCRVICVGNLTAGGTGKTPMAIFLARRLVRKGYRVVMVSRGYRGRAEKVGGVVSDGRQILMDAATAGDEPYLMARSLPDVPVVVGGDRFRAGMIATSQLGAQVVILDDAFQHMALDRDFNLVLMDAGSPLGNGHLLPRGELREPVSALRRAHAVILTRADRLTDLSLARRLEQIKPKAAPAPVFTASHVTRIRGVIPAGGRQMDVPSPVGGQDTDFADARALVFSGVARNDDVHRSVAGLGVRMVRRMTFSDHHYYTDKDHGAIAEAAQSSGADWLITTEKDYVRFAGRFIWPRPLVVIGVNVCLLAGAARLGRLIDACIESDDE